jgi:hypothetical protein
MMIVRPEFGEEIRGEDRVTRQRTRGEAAAEIFARTGIHMPVRGPGNPREATDPEAEIQTEDHVTPVINNAIERGGRNLPALTSFDAVALLKKRKIGGAPKTQDEEIEAADQEVRRNPTTRTPNSFDEFEGLMKPNN